MNIYLLIFVLCLIITISIATNKYFSIIVTRETCEENYMYEEQVKRNLIDKEWYDNLKKESVVLTSKDGLKLDGEFIENPDGNSTKTMVFVHGITVSRIWSIKYIKMFYERGWNILMYDQRRHGRSEGKFSTYGYYEKYDLDLWIQWLVKTQGDNCTIGLHGESMGAATCIQYASINKYVKFIIADCGFSDLKELLMRKVEEKSKLLYPIYHITNLEARVRAKFDFNEVKPIDTVKDTEIPMMFIHGDEDGFVPWDMSVAMYKAKEKGEKALYIAKGAAHARAIEVDKESYEEEVFKFVDTVLSSVNISA